jgi:hypothetical protein
MLPGQIDLIVHPRRNLPQECQEPTVSSNTSVLVAKWRVILDWTSALGVGPPYAVRRDLSRCALQLSATGVIFHSDRPKALANFRRRRRWNKYAHIPVAPFSGNSGYFQGRLGNRAAAQSQVQQILITPGIQLPSRPVMPDRGKDKSLEWLE